MFEASVTAALELWFLTVRISPAPIVMIACPLFCWVPAPEP
jgi:hypothetical protein